jgi:hypothetical protein
MTKEARNPNEVAYHLRLRSSPLTAHNNRLWGNALKSEIRNPKSERSPKSEIRSRRFEPLVIGRGAVHPEVVGAPASGPARSRSGHEPVLAGPEVGAPHGGAVRGDQRLHRPAGGTGSARHHRRLRICNSDFGFRISFGFRFSDFGFAFPMRRRASKALPALHSSLTIPPSSALRGH